jgi:hypothetical protein
MIKLLLKNLIINMQPVHIHQHKDHIPDLDEIVDEWM